MKWKSASGGLCDRRRPLKLKGKFYRTAIRPAMLYGTKCWAVKHQHVHKMGVAEMRMLRWMCGHTRKDKIRNEDIRDGTVHNLDGYFQIHAKYVVTGTGVDVTNAVFIPNSLMYGNSLVSWT
ncbi:hypothetical protein ACFX1X_014537 [Malus domestica]